MLNYIASFCLVIGCEFLASYLTLKDGTQKACQTVRESTPYFSGSLMWNFLSLFLSCVTDKGVRQLNFIRNVFHVDSLLCLWHLKTAVKKSKNVCAVSLCSMIRRTVSTVHDGHKLHSKYCTFFNLQVIDISTCTVQVDAFLAPSEEILKSFLT